MTEKLDLLKIIWQSGIVVKAVLLILILASIYSWAIVLKKKKEWKMLQEINKNFLDAYRTTANLNEILRKSRDMPFSPYSYMFQRGYEEFLKISDKLGANKSKESLQGHFGQFGFGLIERALKQGVNEANEKLDSLLPNLASIGSVSPFIGLFGTVWGIINSFSGLSAQGSTLDAVAPGIAEALVATAIGLVAAIPAVVFYNYFSTENSKMNLKMESFGQEFLNMVERSIISRSSSSP